MHVLKIHTNLYMKINKLQDNLISDILEIRVKHLWVIKNKISSSASGNEVTLYQGSNIWTDSWRWIVNTRWKEDRKAFSGEIACDNSYDRIKKHNLSRLWSIHFDRRKTLLTNNRDKVSWSSSNSRRGERSDNTNRIILD